MTPSLSFKSLESFSDHIDLVVKLLKNAMPPGVIIEKSSLTQFISILQNLLMQKKAQAYLLRSGDRDSLVIAFQELDKVTLEDSVTLFWYAMDFGPNEVSSISNIEEIARDKFAGKQIKLLLPYQNSLGFSEEIQKLGWDRTHWIVGKRLTAPNHPIVASLSLEPGRDEDADFIHQCLGESLWEGLMRAPKQQRPASEVGRFYLENNPSLRVAVAADAGERVGIIAYINRFLGPTLPQVSDYMLDIYVPEKFRGKGYAKNILARSHQLGLIGSGRIVTGNVSGHTLDALRGLVQDAWVTMEQGFTRRFAEES